MPERPQTMDSRRSSTHWLPMLMMVGAACSYGCVSSILKLGYRHGLTSLQLTSAQYDTACLLAWLIVLAHPRRLRIRRGQWGLLTLIALAGTTCSFTYYYALTRLPASLAIVLLFQFTWMVPLLDMVVRRRGLAPAKWLGLLCILAGTLLAVSTRGHLPLRMSVAGIACGLAAAFCYGLQLWLSEFVDESSSPTFRSAILITISAIAATVVARPVWQIEMPHLGQLVLWGGLGGLFAQVIPLLLMSVAIPRIGGRVAGVLGAAELPAAVVLAWGILGEHVGLAQWAGVLLILGGMTTSEFLGKSAAAPVLK